MAIVRSWESGTLDRSWRAALPMDLCSLVAGSFVIVPTCIVSISSTVSSTYARSFASVSSRGKRTGRSSEKASFRMVLYRPVGRMNSFVTAT